MADIFLDHIWKSYDRKSYVVRDVELRVRDGEFLVLLGPSGSGKTTLLRTVAGLEYPDAGRVYIGGRDVTDLPARRRPMSMVFQSYAVFPHLSVYENIAFGLKVRRVDKSSIDRRVRSSASLVKLSDLLDRRPHQLSGGQRQRVAVARAVVMEPQVLLMDEPLSNLDALLRLEFRAELKRLVEQLGITTLYVTHDQVEALSLGDRIAVMREGSILQLDQPAVIYRSPAERFVGSFVGMPPMNILSCRLATAGGTPTVMLGENALARVPWLAAWDGSDIDVGIRAEQVHILDDDSQSPLKALVEVVELVGADLLVTAVIQGQRIKVLQPPSSSVKAGAQLALSFEPEALNYFDASTGLRLEPGVRPDSVTVRSP